MMSEVREQLFPKGEQNFPHSMQAPGIQLIENGMEHSQRLSTA